MKIYRVGGAVRDELLGRPISDRDYVVVGATPEEMIAKGFRPVGRDFPVFLHPESGDEYALARTERKSGRGYHGFSFHVAPDVTLEEDLGRRDLTINAMARDTEGTLIDPYGGERDLSVGILRHVSPAFAEDPLRVLRVARFAARFGFIVAPETEALMRKITVSGELSALTAERVWQELARALMERTPSQFIVVLRRCGALGQLFPENVAITRSAPVPRMRCRVPGATNSLTRRHAGSKARSKWCAVSMQEQLQRGASTTTNCPAASAWRVSGRSAVGRQRMAASLNSR